jgi:hypothetical protein
MHGKARAILRRRAALQNGRCRTVLKSRLWPFTALKFLAFLLRYRLPGPFKRDNVFYHVREGNLFET